MKIVLKISVPLFVVLLFFITIAFAAQTDESLIRENNSKNQYELSNQSHNIRVVLDHIFISDKNNSLEISEIVVFRNEGTEVFYNRDEHTFFAISMPPGARDLKTQAMECCLVEEEGLVYMDPMKPVAPGDNFEMHISYALSPGGREYVFNKSAIYNTTSLSVFVDKGGGMEVEGSFGTLTLQGNEYDIIAFKDIRAGESISVPIGMVEKPYLLYPGLGLLILISIGLMYVFKNKLIRKRGKGETLEELELEKERIFRTIHGFEKHAGNERSEEYLRLMEEYRQKAIKIFIKIDKIKR